MVTCELVQLATRTTHAFCNQTDPRLPAPGTMRPGEFFQRIYSAGELAQVWLRRVQRGETHFRCRRTGPAHSRRAPKLAGTCGFSCTTLSPTVPLAPGSGGGLRTCRRKPGLSLFSRSRMGALELRNRGPFSHEKKQKQNSRSSGSCREGWSCSKSTNGEGRGQADIPQPACRCLTR